MSVRFDLKKGKTKTFIVKDKGRKRDFLIEDERINVVGAFKIKRVYKVGDLYIYYSSNKKLYTINDEYSPLEYLSETFESAPEIIQIYANGESQILIISPDKVVVKKENSYSLSTTIPYGKHVEYFKDKLFLAEGNVLNYSKPTIPDDFSSDIISGGFYKTDLKDGDICGLFCKGDKLFIVCKRAITEIKVNGDESSFIARKLSIPSIEVVEKSFAKKDDICTFISDGKRVVFNGSELEFYDFVDIKGYEVDCAYFSNNLYFIKYDKTNMYFLYYTDKKGDFSGKIQLEKTVFGFGHGYREFDKRLYEIIETEVSLGYVGQYDFGSPDRKAIRFIDIKNFGTSTLEISGDFGKKTFRIKENENKIYCNCYSRSFKINFNDSASDFNIKDFIIKYVTYGD
ncbi:MAG: hypothetical protein MJ066_02155 [Clostridia bacterium]|nr:hypothetical protein [Clostridia bacterium]